MAIEDAEEAARLVAVERVEGERAVLVDLRNEAPRHRLETWSGWGTGGVRVGHGWGTGGVRVGYGWGWGGG